MVANVLEVNPERLWASLERSAEIGRFRDVGLRRLALSAEDKQMHDLFMAVERKGFFAISCILATWFFSNCGFIRSCDICRSC